MNMMSVGLKQFIASSNSTHKKFS